MTRYALIRPPVPALPALTYTVPEALAERAVTGAFVMAPLGSRKIAALVVDARAPAPGKKMRLRDIADIADIPPAPAAFLRFLDNVAAYCLCEPGRVYDLALPKPSFFFADSVNIPYLALEAPPEQPDDLPPKRAAIVQALREAGGSLPKKTLRERAGCGDGAIKAAAEAGLIRAFTHSEAAETAAPAPRPSPDPPVLNDEQHAAAEALSARLGSFSVTLLQGVTGSGKTEVFFAAAEEALRRDPNAQILFLMPEIALTRQMRERVQARFGAEPLLRHAAASEGMKKKAFRAAASGKGCIVLGARSALFLPFRNLKLIVLDEEHDAAYKQEEGVIYHCRDMAALRAREEGCPLILASATPSLESIHNADTGKYARLTLKGRFGAAEMPDIKLIDLKKTPPEKGRLISPPLAQAMAAALAAGGQILLFLNKRGYAPVTLCRSCGYTEECGACSARMVYHRARDMLLCHYCGASRRQDPACPACGSKEERALCGPGAERLPGEVASLFPHARAALLTGDTPGKEAEAVLRDVSERRIDILIGTQIVSKGLHFPALSLVGMTDADMALYGSDPRAAERAWQLIRQTAGRAGRGDAPGSVYIQTHAPNHPLYALLAGDDPDAFPAQELRIRAESMMPPFVKLVCVRFSAPAEHIAAEAAAMFAEAVKHAADTVLPPPERAAFALFGPAAPPVGKRSHRFLMRLILRARTHAALKAVLLHAKARAILPAKAECVTDVDPLTL